MRRAKPKNDGFLWGFRGTRSPTRGACEVTPRATMADVRECARQCGSHFFDRDTLRFFNSKIGRTAYEDGTGGAFFVTSEQASHAASRYHIVRHYDASKCSFRTAGGRQEYQTAKQANAAAKKAALQAKKAARPPTGT